MGEKEEIQKEEFNQKSGVVKLAILMLMVSGLTCYGTILLLNYLETYKIKLEDSLLLVICFITMIVGAGLIFESMKIKYARHTNIDSMANSFYEKTVQLSKNINHLELLSYMTLLMIASSLILILTTFEGTSIKSFLYRMSIILPLTCLAWLTHQKSVYLIKIREDYSYKASLIMTFESYKTEAKGESEESVNKLFDVIVANLRENPVRLFNGKVKNTPVSSKELIKALEVIKTVKETFTK